MAAHNLQETCFNGENVPKEATLFEQQMMKLGAKPKLIKILIENDYDSIDILLQLKTNTDILEVVNDCNLKSAQKFQLKAMIEKMPNLNQNKQQLEIRKNIKNKQILIEKSFDEIQNCLNNRKKMLLEQLNKIGNDEINKLNEEYKLDEEYKFGQEIHINLDVKKEIIECINKFRVSSVSKCKIFQYESNSNKNEGIIHYLGTKYINNESNEWINPFNNKLVNISTSELEKGNKLSQFIDRKLIKTEFKTKNIKNSFFVVDFNQIKIKPSYYTLRHSSGYGYYLRCWSFQGFNNNEWKTIKEYKNDHSLSRKNKFASFSLTDCNQFYSKFRIIMNKKNSGDHFGLSGSDWTLCAYGFELYGQAIFSP
eukprot:468499_1